MARVLLLPRDIGGDEVSYTMFSVLGFLGVLLIGIAVGIWKRSMLAWQWGFVAIVLSAIFFVAQICSELPAVNTNEKIVIISACSVGATLVASYWWSIWYRQKKWFA